MTPFPEKLKSLRNRKGITQQELANNVEVSRTAIAGYESLGKEPSFEVLSKIANFFNVSVDYLLGLSDYENPSNKPIIEKLGLTEKSINFFKQQLPSYDKMDIESDDRALIDVFNQMLSVYDGFSFSELVSYVRCATTNGTLPVINSNSIILNGKIQNSEMTPDQKIASRQIIIALYKNQACDKLKEIIDTIGRANAVKSNGDKGLNIKR